MAYQKDVRGILEVHVNVEVVQVHAQGENVDGLGAALAHADLGAELGLLKVEKLFFPVKIAVRHALHVALLPRLLKNNMR